METFRPLEAEPAVFVGIDVAKQQHEVLIDVPGRRRRSIKVPNSRSGFTDLVRELKRHDLPVHVALEATGDYHRALASFLHRSGVRLHLASSVATSLDSSGK